MYKRTQKKVKTVLGQKTVYRDEKGKQYIYVGGRYYPLNPK